MEILTGERQTHSTLFDSVSIMASSCETSVLSNDPVTLRESGECPIDRNPFALPHAWRDPDGG
jgi:hypothetical protein